MAKKMKKLQNKKPLIAAIVGVIAIAIVGATLAVQGDITRFFNSATLGTSGATFTEQFVSPTNWKPCDTQPKTVTATNSGSNPVIVRVTYEDYWITQSGASLPLEQDGLKLGVINFDNPDDWTLNTEDGWYYYKAPLQPGESTSSFMKSVTFNCAYNLGSNELNVCDSDGNCTTPANAYGNAKYHVSVTIQTTQDGGDWPKEAICNSKILYNRIACYTNGPDTNVDFMVGANDYNASNGLGINTRSTTANDAYPVYYYRGTVTNNFVIWANYCWRIIRTTSTGGVKLLYSGEVTDDGTLGCKTNPDHPGVSDYYTRFSNGPMAHTTVTQAEAYYMYGDLRPRGGTIRIRHGGEWDPTGGTYGLGDYTGARIGTALTYDGSRYYAAGDVLEGDWANMSATDRASHNYACDDERDGSERHKNCLRGAVVLYDNTEAFVLYDGELTIEEAMNNMAANTYNSKAKQIVDDWYAANLTAYASQLEDTVFCADRRYSGLLRDATYTTGSTYTPYGGTLGVRNPSVTCAQKNDSFTVNESATGNGALTYPIGLLTVDEASMIGSVWSVIDYDSWIHYTGYGDSYGSTWTMSPYYASGRDNVLLFVAGESGGNTLEMNMRPSGTQLIRPVVSLKPGTRYRTGTGTVSKPYIIK